MDSTIVITISISTLISIGLLICNILIYVKELNWCNDILTSYLSNRYHYNMYTIAKYYRRAIYKLFLLNIVVVVLLTGIWIYLFKIHSV